MDREDYKDEGMILLNNFRTPSNNNPIGRDLEARTRRKTLDGLKKQAEGYKEFNESILYLMDPWAQKTRIVNFLKANPEAQ